MARSATLDDDRRLLRLSPETYVFASYPFCGLVVTDEGCIAIDGPMSPRNCAPWREFVDGHGPLRYQVYCEHHGDHIASACYLEPQTLVTSERTRSEMGSTVEMLDSFATWGHDPQLAPGALGGFELWYPTLTYNERLTITLGGKRFVLFEAPGHTLGSTVVHAVDDRVAFIADNGFTPAIQSGDPFAWLSTIATLETLDVDWFVQGHGNPFDRGALGTWRNALLEAVDRFRQMRAEGLTAAQTVERGGVFPDFEFPDHPGTADMPPNLAAVAASVLQERGAQMMFDALDRHPSAGIHSPPMSSSPEPRVRTI